jgi:hypothetical protein
LGKAFVDILKEIRSAIKNVAQYADRAALASRAAASCLPSHGRDHREVHRCGDEGAWWRNIGIDPTVNTGALWLQTRPLPAAPEGPQPPDPGSYQFLDVTSGSAANESAPLATGSSTDFQPDLQ